MKTFLLVDDDKVFLRVLCNALLARNYDVRMAENTTNAYKVAQNYFPEHVILDLKMPGESGLTLIEKILALDPNTKILILTGYASIPTAVEAMKLGALHYMSKPASVEEILAGLKKSQANSNMQIDSPLPTLAEVEEQTIAQSLARNNGNISAAARELGVHRRTLQRKLSKKS